MSVLAFVEFDDAGLRKSAAEVIKAARELAGKLGQTWSVAVAGADPSGVTKELGMFEPARVYTVADAALARYQSDGFSRAVAAVVGEAEATTVLLAASMTGKDLGPALAARIGAGLINDAIAIDVVDGEMRATRPVYAGKAQVTVSPAEGPTVVSIRPNVFPASDVDADSEANVVAVDAGLAAEALRAVIREVKEPEERTVDLTEADIVVSGGRGMKGPENFHLVEALAAALGGVVGASRAVVDAGWRPHSEQVGQTGKTVSPKLYVACGISGAIQHLAGMSSSKCIVAINNDPEAPIFQVADYGIVGDVMEVLPALTEKISAVMSS
jgi:electron transfer flavoprotein alpha subunit